MYIPTISSTNFDLINNLVLSNPLDSGPTPEAEKILEKYSADPNFLAIYNSHVQNMKNVYKQSGSKGLENYRNILNDSFSSLLKGYSDPQIDNDTKTLVNSVFQEASGSPPPKNLQEVEANLKTWGEANHQESFYENVMNYINDPQHPITDVDNLINSMQEILNSITGNNRDIYFKIPGLNENMLQDAYDIIGAGHAPKMNNLDHAYSNLVHSEISPQFQGATNAIMNELMNPKNTEDDVRHYLNDVSGSFMKDFYNKSGFDQDKFNKFALTNIPDWTDKSPTPPPHTDFYPFTFNNNTGYPDADVKLTLVAECTNPPYYIKYDAQGNPQKTPYSGKLPADATFSLASIPGPERARIFNIPKDLPAARLYFSVGDGQGLSYSGGSMQNFLEFTNLNGGLDMDTSCVDGVNLPLSFQVKSQGGTWNAGQPGSRADLMKALQDEYATDPVWKQMWDKNYDAHNGILSPIHTIPNDYFGTTDQSNSWAKAFYNQFLNTSISMDDVGGGKWTGKIVGIEDGCPKMTFTSTDGRSVTFKVPTTSSSAIMSGNPGAWQIAGEQVPPEFASIIRDLSCAITTNTLPLNGETLNVGYFHNQGQENKFFQQRSDYASPALNFIDHYSKVLHERGCDHHEYDFAYSDELGDSSNIDLIPGSSFVSGSITLGDLK